MHQYDSAEVLKIGAMLDEDESTFPLEAFKALLEYLNPDNLIVERCSQKAWSDAIASESTVKKTEQWYNIEYALTPNSNLVTALKGATLGSPSSSLHLPLPNRYIPRSLEIHPSLPTEARMGPRISLPMERPHLLLDVPGGRLFWRLDDRYSQPKSVLTVLLRNPSSCHRASSPGAPPRYCPVAGASSALYAALLEHALTQETYDAHCSGLHFSITATDAGFNLVVQGYSCRLGDFAAALLERMVSRRQPAGDAAMFAVVKERRIRALKSFHKERPDYAADHYVAAMLHPERVESYERREEITNSIEFQQMIEHVNDNALNPSKIFLEVFYTGNVGLDEAKVRK
jgi:secreted Zn-dependent insulinase-like peptidase